MEFILDNWLTILIVLGISVGCIPLLLVLGLFMRLLGPSNQNVNSTRFVQTPPPTSQSREADAFLSPRYSPPHFPVTPHYDLYTPRGRLLGDLEPLRKGPNLSHLRVEPNLEVLRKATSFGEPNLQKAHDLFVVKRRTDD